MGLQVFTEGVPISNSLLEFCHAPVNRSISDPSWLPSHAVVVRIEAGAVSAGDLDPVGLVDATGVLIGRTDGKAQANLIQRSCAIEMLRPRQPPRKGPDPG